MALPPKDMHLSCLRCKTPLGEDENICPSCGANREVEMAVAAELEPAVASLQRWLLVLGLGSIGLALLSWYHFRDKLPGNDAWMVAAPAIANGALWLILCAVARRAPFGIAITALVLFGLGWLSLLATEPAAAIGPNLGTLVRVLFLFVLIGAIQSGYKARRIRQIADEKLAAHARAA